MINSDSFYQITCLQTKDWAYSSLCSSDQFFLILILSSCFLNRCFLRIRWIFDCSFCHHWLFSWSRWNEESLDKEKVVHHLFLTFSFQKKHTPPSQRNHELSFSESPMDLLRDSRRIQSYWRSTYISMVNSSNHCN